MARATVSKMKKGARRFAKQTRVFIRLFGRGLNARREALALFFAGLMTSVTNHPFVRRSRLRRDGAWFWRRLMVLMSDGYNFEDFYRTQHGLGTGPDGVSPESFDRLPSAVLLAKAYDLADDAQGIAAMRVLVERAVLKAMARETVGHAAGTYEPKPHDPSIHRQWHEAIEAAFAPVRPKQNLPEEMPDFVTGRRSKANPVVELPLWQRPVPLMAADDAAFELSIPQVAAYRASTRH